MRVLRCALVALQAAEVAAVLRMGVGVLAPLSPAGGEGALLVQPARQELRSISRAAYYVRALALQLSRLD